MNISGCIITNSTKGILTYSPQPDEFEVNENLLTDLNITECTFDSIVTGIELNGNSNPFSSVNINANHFEDCENGIVINAFSYNDISFVPEISNNIISGYTNGNSEIGISLSNGAEAIVTNNSITNFLTGINLNMVDYPIVKENTISAIDLPSNVDPLSGIFSVSCSGGEFRLNTIQNHLHGFELSSSSPKLGANSITNNDSYGIYINDNSHPDLSEAFVGEEEYPLSGYNTIRENGRCSLYSISELYLKDRSTANLEKGCNTIADDREDDPVHHCGYLYLIDGIKIEGTINAVHNYWGNHPVYGNDPTGRFGLEITVDYSDYLSEPCTYSQGSVELLLATSNGEVYDTVYSTGDTQSNLTDIESRYAAANDYYYHNQYSQAKQEYEGIIQNYGNDKVSLQAYNRLYTLAEMMNNSPGSFNQLREYYLQKAGDQTDSTMISSLTHLSDLCLVSAEEYLTAINNFDEIAQQNQNTDIALYRQIDALTTALLLPQDSTMNKGMLGKYSVKDLSDYTNKLSELIKTRGKSGLESEKEILPTEYTLYQNFPNPFNPTTTIKYDLPNTSDVLLIIYDILGRKVKELVNTKQQVGRYEIQFNASILASGVYIYQLIAEKYISSKKMILLK